MNGGLFRQKSIDKVSSPEQLNEYLRAVSPGAWISVASLTAFVVGLAVWCIFGSIETRVPAVAVVRDGECICYTSAEKYASPEKGMKITVGETFGEIISSDGEPSVIGEGDGEAYLLYRSGMEKGEFCYETKAEVEGLLADGVHEAMIVFESASPISFILR